MQSLFSFGDTSLGNKKKTDPGYIDEIEKHV